MSMIISQDYMEKYVINPMARKIAELEKKIDLVKSNTEFLIEQFDKVIKNIKKAK
uniref:Uncharacterized protein n=1 Tax=viral metagenome TaxID=1070528 RepID=A0A6M3K0Y0_9ZZZZ